MVDERLEAGLSRADARRHAIRTRSCKQQASCRGVGAGSHGRVPWSIPCFLIPTSPSIPLKNTLTYQEGLLLASSDAKHWQFQEAAEQVVD